MSAKNASAKVQSGSDHDYSIPACSGMARIRTVYLCFAVFCCHAASAEGIHAHDQPAAQPLKYYLDFTYQSPAVLFRSLKRAETYFRGTRGQTKIAMILHGYDIGLLGNPGQNGHENLVKLITRLATDGIIEVKACRLAAFRNHLSPLDMPDFIEWFPYIPDERQRLRSEEGYLPFPKTLH
ncbi:MAG: hypothetical protein ACE5GZ_10270 [Gammaproteobacteria bacterium]